MLSKYDWDNIAQENYKKFSTICQKWLAALFIKLLSQLPNILKTKNGDHKDEKLDLEVIQTILDGIKMGMQPKI